MKSPLLYVGLLFIFAMTAALVGPLFIDWSNYRADIEAYGERITGRQVKVNGDIEVRLLPAPILRVGDVRVANPVEAASPELLVAREIEAKLSLAPLLRGKIEIASVEVDQPVIEAEALPGGGTWVLSPMGGFERMLVADDIRLEDARITDGVLVVRDPSRDFVAQFDKLNVSLQAPSLAGPYKVQGTFEKDGTARAISLSTGRRHADRPTHLSLSLSPASGQGKSYGLDGAVDWTSGEAMFKGRLRIREVDTEAGKEGEAGSGKADLRTAELSQLLAFELRAEVEATFDEAVLEQVQFILGSGRSRATMIGRARVDLWNGPRLDAKLSARRLDLDSVVTGQQVDGEEPRPTPSTKDILSQIPRLLEFLPKTLNGQLAMDVEGLVLGGHQIEGAGVTLRFAPEALTVSRAVGRLPGQSQLSITGTYHPDAEDTDFDGIFSLNARDAKTFITWMAPRLLPVLNPNAGGARGNLTLQGELRVKKTLVELVGVEATVDKSKARLGLSVAFTKRLAFGLRVILDEFNLDRYLPTQAAAGQGADDEDGDVAEGAAGNPLAILGEFDANIVVQAKDMIARGTDMRDMSADLTLRGGTLTVKNLSVADLGGAQVQVRGELKDVANRPEGRLEGTFDSTDPTDFLALVGARPADAGPASAWARWARGWGPTSLTAILEAGADGETPKIDVEMSGYFAQSKVSVNGTLEGGLGRIADGRTHLKFELANEHGDELLRQIGLAAASAPEGETRPGVVRGDVSGTLDDGLDMTIAAQAYGGELDIKGKARRIAGVTSLEAEVKLVANDAGPLYRAMSLTGGEAGDAGGGLNLRALVAGKDGEFVVTGLTGTVADVPVNLNGSVAVGGGSPRIRLTANVGEVSMPWAIGVIVAGDGSRDPVAQAVAAVGDSGAVVPVWSPQPFRPDNLDYLNVELKAEVGKLTLGEGVAVNNASFQASLGDGKLELKDLKGELFGGRLELSGSLAAARSRVTLESTYAVTGADLGRLSAYASSAAAVTGRATLRGNVKGTGRNALALMSSLGGAGTLTVEDAALREFDAPAFADALREARDEEQVATAAKKVLIGDSLDVGSVSTSYTIASGLARFDPVDVKTDAASGRVSTIIDLAAWRFDNDWQLTLANVADAPPMSVSIAGPLGVGERKLDIRDLGIFLTMKALREDTARVEEMERQAREQIRLQELELKRIEDKARSEREEREREQRETTLTPQSPLDAPIAPPASGGGSTLEKQVDRITPEAPRVKKSPAPPPSGGDGVIRLGPNQSVPAARDTPATLAPDGVETQALPPPTQ